MLVTHGNRRFKRRPSALRVVSVGLMAALAVLAIGLCVVRYRPVVWWSGTSVYELTCGPVSIQPWNLFSGYSHFTDDCEIWAWRSGDWIVICKRVQTSRVPGPDGRFPD